MPPRTNEAGPAILMALLAFALFTVMDTCIKLLGGRYHVAQVVFFNGLFSIPPVLLLTSMRGGFHRLASTRLKLHALRGVLSIVGVTCTFWALARMQIADVYAILFAVPLLLVALSAVVLGETVSPKRWSAVVVGFLGVVVILGPGGSVVDFGAIAAFAAAVLGAFNLLLVRYMSDTEPNDRFAFYGNCSLVVGASTALPFFFLTPTFGDLLLSMVGGTAGVSGFLVLVQAYKAAPVATVAPFQYSQMLYAIAVGYVLFDTLPDSRTLLGAAIVIASGLYLLRQATRPAGG